MKIMMKGAIAVLILCIAFGGGIYVGIEYQARKDFAIDLIQYSQSNQAIEQALKSGDDARLEEATRAHIRLIHLCGEGNKKFCSTLSLATDTDLQLSFARLSELAKRRGEISESEALLTKAKSYCSEMDTVCDPILLLEASSGDSL